MLEVIDFCELGLNLVPNLVSNQFPSLFEQKNGLRFRAKSKISVDLPVFRNSLFEKQ